jgi:uncharacterized integral membrane protein
MFWLFALPLFCAIVVFAVVNPGLVEVSIWPVLEQKVLFPLYGVALIGILFGFVLGAVVTFLQGGRTRQRSRDLARRLEADQRERALLRQQMNRLEAERADAPPATRLPAPAPAPADPV